MGEVELEICLVLCGYCVYNVERRPLYTFYLSWDASLQGTQKEELCQHILAWSISLNKGLRR